MNEQMNGQENNPKARCCGHNQSNKYPNQCKTFAVTFQNHEWFPSSDKKHTQEYVCLFVLRFYGPVNLMGSCRAWSVYQTTLFLGRLSPLSGWPVLVHILSPETDNCPSWISGRVIMTIQNISWSISMKECCLTQRRSNKGPPDYHQKHIQLSHQGLQLFNPL